MYTPATEEPSPTHIEPCPCCGASASVCVGRATVFIQCDNSECGLATKGHKNVDWAKKFWNRRV